MRRILCAAVLLAALPAQGAEVDGQAVTVRLGRHDGFGRVVFEFAGKQSFTSERSGNVLLLRFPGVGEIPSQTGTTRNVTSVVGGAGVASVTLTPGARVRVMQLDNRVVIDAHAPEATHRLATRPANSGNGLSPTRVSDALEPTPPTTASSTTPIAPAVPAVEAVSAPPVQPPLPATPGPAVIPPPTLAVAAVPASPPDVQGGDDASVLPFGPAVAAAAFRHGDEAWIVFDERRPLDAGSFANDPVLASAVVQLLPSATLLRAKLADGRSLRLEHHADGWIAVAVGPGSDGPATMPITRSSRLVIPASSMGEVVVVPDPETGRNLLVGTLKAAGPGVPVAIHAPEFGIWPSWQGAVIEPISDRTSLRVIQDGFAVETGGPLSPAPDAGSALASAASLTRRFDFAAEPVTTLLRRLQLQVQDEGQAAPQARLSPRKSAAQTMLALGLGAEAQSLLRLAVAEDPRAAADPDINGLTAIAALLSGRPEEAGGLDLPELAGSDEVTLWRAVRTASLQENSPEAASAFAATVGLALAYPDALRRRVLPLAAEAMVRGGATSGIDALLAALPNEPLLTFARALRLQQKGDTAAALVLYDALAVGRDRLTSARAATCATDLRLSSGAIGPAEAAKLLESSLQDWRGDGRERDLRLRTATVEAQAGQWRKALDTMKEAAQLFPSDSPMIRAGMTRLLGELLHGPGAAAIAPLDLVTLAEENADLVGQADSSGMALLLADKLISLDLPQRADPVIERMAAASPPGIGRAALGARLASLRLDDGDLPRAAAALTTTDAADLPPALQEERGLIDARIHARTRDVAGATAILSRLGTAAADDLRATILAESGDWHGAATSLAALIAKTVPDAGTLDASQQALLLRLASAQSRAADDGALRILGAKETARMSGPQGDMFRLLTTTPVRDVGDLRRAGKDIALARALPSALGTLGAR